MSASTSCVAIMPRLLQLAEALRVAFSLLWCAVLMPQHTFTQPGPVRLPGHVLLQQMLPDAPRNELHAGGATTTAKLTCTVCNNLTRTREFKRFCLKASGGGKGSGRPTAPAPLLDRPPLQLQPTSHAETSNPDLRTHGRTASHIPRPVATKCPLAGAGSMLDHERQ